jgi:hypothetical protein
VVEFREEPEPQRAGLEHWAQYDPKNELWFNISTTPKPEPFNHGGVDVLAAIQEEVRRKQ